MSKRNILESNVDHFIERAQTAHDAYAQSGLHNDYMRAKKAYEDLALHILLYIRKGANIRVDEPAGGIVFGPAPTMFFTGDELSQQMLSHIINAEIPLIDFRWAELDPRYGEYKSKADGGNDENTE